MPDQTPPGGRSKYVGNQVSFHLQHIMGASRSEGSHTFVRPETKWDGNVVKLWLNPLSAKGWYWNNGHQLQMAHEAAENLFDQRLLAQRWAIRESMLVEVLPEGYCSTELDVEQMSQQKLILSYLQRKGDRRLSTKDWTVWLFLAMTQPEQEPAVVDWYWWVACCIFVGIETFTRVMAEHPLPCLEGIPYIPRRLMTPATGFGVNDLVEHFVSCGLRLQDAKMLFRDFTSHYLAHVPEPTKLDWSKVLPLPELMSRGMIKERTKLRKEFLGACTEPLPMGVQPEPRARELAPIQAMTMQTTSLLLVISQAELSLTPASPNPEPRDISMGLDVPVE